MNTTTAEYATHLICWRSDPLAPRKRSTSETTAAARSPTNTRKPIPNGRAIGSNDERYSGFASPLSLKVGAPRIARHPHTTMTPSVTVSHRHRGLGGRPSGNHSSSNTRPGSSPMSQPTSPISAPHAAIDPAVPWFAR